MHDLPAWVDRTEYPFSPRALETRHGTVRYVDEGNGEPIVFVHGNPTWSFMYRALIGGLRNHYRCIAPDHLGFGLSDKPRGVSYLPQLHAENLEQLIATHALRDVTLVLHDWGGPIGMQYAVRNPANVKRLIVLNTTCWSLRGVKGAERFSWFVGSFVGRFLFRRCNVLPRFLLPRLFADRARLTPHIHRHYVAPFPTPDSREGVWTLAKSLLAESEWMEAVWNATDLLRDKPVLILCGRQDPTFGPEKLAKWQAAFPRHTTTLAHHDVGHCVAEELGPRALEPVERFLAATA